MAFGVTLVFILLIWSNGGEITTAKPTWMRQMWDQLTGISANQTPPKQLVTELEKQTDEIDLLWGISDKNAVVGHLFKYQIPHYAFTGKADTFQVQEAGSSELPPWLYFNSSSQSFFGVASPLDMGATAIEVKASTRRGNCSVSTHFIINVQASEHMLDNWQGNPGSTNEMANIRERNSLKMEETAKSACRLDQNAYRAILVLDTSMDKLPAKMRVKLMYKAAQFLSQKTSTLHIGPRKSNSIARLLDTTTIKAGPGDTLMSSSDGVELSWIVGCETLSGADDLARVLQHNILVGRFRDELGYQLTGWLITETLPPEPLRKLSRRKRQAKVNATPMPTPTLPSNVPSQVTSFVTVSLLETTSVVPQSSQTDLLYSSPVSSVPSSESSSVAVELELTSQIYRTIDVSETQSTHTTRIFSTDIGVESVETSIPKFSTPSLATTASLSDLLSSSAEEISSKHLDNLSSSITSEFSVRFTSEEQLLSSFSSSYLEPSIDSFSEVPESSLAMSLTSDLSRGTTSKTSILELSSPSIMSTSKTIAIEMTPSVESELSSVSSAIFSDFSSIPSILPTPASSFIQMSTEAESELLFSTVPSVVSEELPSSSPIDETELSSTASEEVTEPLPSTAFINKSNAEFRTDLLFPTSEEVTEQLPPSSLIEESITETELLFSTSQVVSAKLTASPLIDEAFTETELLFSTSSEVASEQLTSSPIESITTDIPSFVAVASASMTDMYGEPSSLLTSSPSNSAEIDSSLSSLPESSKIKEVLTEIPTVSLDISLETSETHITDMTLEIVPTITLTDTIASFFHTGSISESTNDLGIPIGSTSFLTVSSQEVRTTRSRSSLISTPASAEGSFEFPTTTDQQQLTSFSSLDHSLLTTLPKTIPTTSTVNSVPTSSIVNLVSVAPSSGQTLDFILIGTPIITQKPTLTITWPSTTTLSVLSTQAIMETQTLPTTPPSSDLSFTSIIIGASSSIASVITQSLPLVLPSTSTVPDISLEESTQLLSVSSSPSVGSTQYSPVYTLLSSSQSSLPTSLSSGIDTSTQSFIPEVTSTYISTASSSVITTTPVNNPPQLMNPINRINARLCIYFEYLIPADTFYDYEEGNTRNLKLELLTLTRQELTPASWVQFDSKRQTIFGIAQEKDLPTKDADREFVLVAEDSLGLQVQEALIISISVGSYQNSSHQFTVTIDEDYLTFITTTSNLINLIITIARYYGDVSPMNMTVNNVTSGSVEVHWSNNTLSRSVCDNKTIEQLYSELSEEGKVNPEFRRATFPRYNILDVGLQYQGVCLPSPSPPVTPSSSSEPAVLGSTDSSVYYYTVIPAVIIALLLLIGIIICVCLQRRRRLAGRILLDDEKPIFVHDRHPVLLEGELEMRDIGHKRHRPLVLTHDGSYMNPTFPGATRRAPARPPPYQVPDGYSSFFDDVVDAASVSPPPDYASDAAALYSRPPPAYRLPPPYSSNASSSDA